jgi:acetyltransferase-like isoleucine patch superfamily enzyme
MALARTAFEALQLRFLNQFESIALRKYYKNTYNIEIGLYSYGCFDRWRIPPGSVIGRYCSFAKTARVLDANHPLGAISTHPYLYDPHFGIVSESHVTRTDIVIEDDVWISHNATLTSSTKRVGRGAVVGAGAVVTHEVPPYAIVAGVPAKVIRYRFDAATISLIEKSQWWLRDRFELARFVKNDPSFAFRT